MNNIFQTRVDGHVLIKDKNTNEILLDKTNAIHNHHMALAIARGLAKETNAHIYKVCLGNGGTAVNSAGDIIYSDPNVEAANADLYNATYAEVIDETDTMVGIRNDVKSYDLNPSTKTTTVKCHFELTADEPIGQDGDDGPNDPALPPDTVNEAFMFDELGLKTNDQVGTTYSSGTDIYSGMLLSHIIFSPIEKTSNRELIIEYTLTITVS